MKRYIILLFLSAILILPELNNSHYTPMPQFWAEITAVLGVVAICAYVLLTYSALYVTVTTLPIIILCVLIVIQPYFLNISFVGISYLICCELILCIMLNIAIQTLFRQHGAAQIVYVVSALCIIGSILQSLIAITQYCGWASFLKIIFYDAHNQTTNIIGHLGQRNHLCHYIMWGVIGAIYLYVSGYIKPILLVMLLSIFGFVVTIAASRSIHMYAVAAIVISMLLSKDRTVKRMCYVFIMFYAGLLLFQHMYSTSYHAASGLSRLSNIDDSAIRRIVEWQKAWIMFAQHPLIGSGINEFARYSIALHGLFPDATTDYGLFTNCHNMPLFILSGVGIIGAICVAITIGYTIYKLWITPPSAEQVALLCMIATTMLHSMVEYPLSYFYFLSAFTIFLSCVKVPAWRIYNKSAYTILIIIAIYVTLHGIHTVLSFTKYSRVPNNSNDFKYNVQQLEQMVNHDTLWAYYALYVLDDYIIPHSKLTNLALTLKQQLLYEERFTLVTPYPYNLIKCYILYNDSGESMQAKYSLRMAELYYSSHKSKFAKIIINS